MTIVVDPFDAQPLGALTHIGEKILKPQPAVADSDSATAITSKAGAVRIDAPLDYVLSKKFRAPDMFCRNHRGAGRKTHYASALPDRLQ